jgi:hypothetical protein
VSLLLKYECLNLQKLNRAFLSEKEAIIRRLTEIERLLLLVDRKMYQERKNLVKLLQYVGGGIEGRETNIKDLLKEIASLEMKKSDEEDRLSEQTLKTIEIVNIDDIKDEKANLEKNIQSLN